MTWELFPRDKTTPQTNSSTPASAPIPDPFKPVPTDPETLAVSDESEKQDQGGLSHASKQQSSKNQAEEGINDCVVSSEPPTKQSPPAIQTRPVFECAEFMCDHGKLKISSIGSVKRVAEVRPSHSSLKFADQSVFKGSGLYACPRGSHFDRSCFFVVSRLCIYCAQWWVLSCLIVHCTSSHV